MYDGNVEERKRKEVSSKASCIYGDKQKTFEYKIKWRSQNAETIRPITGKLAEILFKLGTSVKVKNLCPEGANSFH